MASMVLEASEAEPHDDFGTCVPHVLIWYSIYHPTKFYLFSSLYWMGNIGYRASAKGEP